jgi:hypothetical protein
MQAVKDKFQQPTEISDVGLVFPGSVLHLMPEYAQIPEEFKRSGNKWCKWQSDWFYAGLSEMPRAQEGIDLQKALRHLKAIQGSWEPKHEHKQAAVAYLASQWLELP